MTVARIQVALNGAPVVGPGLMTFYTRNLTPGSLPGSIVTFLNALATTFAPGIVCAVPNSGDTIDETTGALVGGWTGTGGANVTTSGNGAYALGNGGRIEWVTSLTFAGHHPRGRTFLVPFVNMAFGTDGKLVASTHDLIQSAANNLITAGAGDLVVWARPRKGYVGKKGPLPDRPGSIVPITSANVPVVPTSLRSRRR